MRQGTMIEQLVKTFVVFFLVIEPISLVPMFAALTRGGEPGYRSKMAYKSIATMCSKRWE
jgi:small neutral amino acid transporter SnatA (MarC family)